MQPGAARRHATAREADVRSRFTQLVRDHCRSAVRRPTLISIARWSSGVNRRVGRHAQARCRAGAAWRYSGHVDSDRQESQEHRAHFAEQGTLGGLCAPRGAEGVAPLRGDGNSSWNYSVGQQEDLVRLGSEIDEETCQEEFIGAKARIASLGPFGLRGLRLHQLPFRSRVLAPLRGVGLLHHRLRLRSAMRARRAGLWRSQNSPYPEPHQHVSVFHPRSLSRRADSGSSAVQHAVRARARSRVPNLWPSQPSAKAEPDPRLRSLSVPALSLGHRRSRHPSSLEFAR